MNHREDLSDTKKGSVKSMSTWFVTFSALIRYAREARSAQAELNEAKEAMKNAAEELCSKWTGDAATAFAQEQGVLDNWFTQLIDVVSEYIGLVESTATKYEEEEAALASKVHG